MEHQINNGLERIENPILLILLIVLMAAVVALWLRDIQRERKLIELLTDMIASQVETNSVLERILENDKVQTASINQAMNLSFELLSKQFKNSQP